MERTGARLMEVQPGVFERFNAHVQAHLGHTVWNGCKSWYIDANGHNSTNWPGFTLSYRWITRTTGLDAYRFSSATAQAQGVPHAA
jgi:hypothetical protein